MTIALGETEGGGGDGELEDEEDDEVSEENTSVMFAKGSGGSPNKVLILSCLRVVQVRDFTKRSSVGRGGEVRASSVFRNVNAMNRMGSQATDGGRHSPNAISRNQ